MDWQGSAEDADETLGTSEEAVISMNRLSLNRLSLNGMTMRSLSRAPLSTDGSLLGETDLLSTQEGRELLSYAIQCAMPKGTQLKGKVGSTTYVFQGHLGLAPEWKRGPLFRSGQRWVTACLLAHGNAYGESVPISLSGPSPALQRTAQEKQQFSVQEASFYGNVFVDEGPGQQHGVAPGQEPGGRQGQGPGFVPGTEPGQAGQGPGLNPGQQGPGINPGQEPGQAGQGPGLNPGQQGPGVAPGQQPGMGSQQNAGITTPEQGSSTQLYSCAGQGIQSGESGQEQYRPLRGCGPDGQCPLQMTGACIDVTPAQQDSCETTQQGGYTQCHTATSQRNAGWAQSDEPYQEVITVNLRPEDFDRFYGQGQF